MQKETQKRYIPGLDGLRALAVVAVVIYHFVPSVLPGGFIGVDIFFVISGFLITTLLINERYAKGRIDFKKFWSRRAKRLLPGLLTVISIVAAAAFFVRGDVLVGIGRQLLGAVTFSSNWLDIAARSNYFDGTSLHLFTNLWSLAVEEQFYLVWPIVVTILAGAPFLKRRPILNMWICISAGAASALLMARFFSNESATRVYYGTDTHLFGLMAGAASAFWLHARNTSPVFRPWSPSKKKFVRRFSLFALIALIGIMVNMSDTDPFTYRGGLALVSALTVLVMIGTISSKGLLRKIFTLPPFVWTGIRSYGIYLWHWPLFALGRYIFPSSFPRWGVISITAAVTLIAAALSFRYVEQPIRRDGFKTFVRSCFKKKVMRGHREMWKFRLHPGLVTGCIVAGLTVAAIVNAPSKTLAELRIEEGQRAIQESRQQQPAPTTVEPEPIVEQKQKPVATVAVDGSYITIIGDSVTLASARALQERFPGILIDAEVSRSLRGNGQTTIDNLAATGQLRPVVVVALGTNGYLGEGSLEKLASQLSDKKVIFVTAFTDREWAAANNEYMKATAQKYPNIYIANWAQAIAPHPEFLAADETHPDSHGGKIYAETIAATIANIR